MAYLFCVGIGILFGIIIGMMLSLLFDEWSRMAAKWIMSKFYKDSR